MTPRTAAPTAAESRRLPRHWPEARLRAFLGERIGLDPGRLDAYLMGRVTRVLAEPDMSESSREQSLIAAATVQETCFLRHAQQFQWLVNRWLPQQIERRRAAAAPAMLHVLSAGCATGEEPYSLAAVLGPAARAADFGVAITAIDVCGPALNAARNGEYHLWSLRGVDVDAHPWLDVSDRRVRVRDEARANVRFHWHNLLQPLRDCRPQGGFDLVFCRNVMIYLHSAALRRVWRNLVAAAHPNAAFVVAPGDPAPPADVGLACHWEDDVRVFSLPASPPGESAAPAVPTPATPAPPGPLRRNGDAAPTTTPLHLVTMATRLVQSRQFAVAEQLLDAAVAADPFCVRAHLLQALLWAEQGRCDAALAAARRAVYLDAQAAYCHFVLGDVAGRCAQPALAERALAAARRLVAAADGARPLAHCEELTVAQLRSILDVHRSD